MRLVNENRTVTAEKILIATGNRPTREMGTYSHHSRAANSCITSNEAFQLEKLPERILIARRRLYRAGIRAIFFMASGQPCPRWSIAATSCCAASMIVRYAHRFVRVHARRGGWEVLLGCEFAKVEKRGNDACMPSTNKVATDRMRPDHAGDRPPAQHRYAACRKGRRRTWASAVAGDGGPAIPAPPRRRISGRWA